MPRCALNTTGYMHNRLRMVTASFFSKHLLLDWRLGEAYFAGKLIDFDQSANNGGWQWAASTGCDAQPYFRIFNPINQSEKFDAEGKFIRRYVPGLQGARQIRPRAVDAAAARGAVIRVCTWPRLPKSDRRPRHAARRGTQALCHCGQKQGLIK